MPLLNAPNPIDVIKIMLTIAGALLLYRARCRHQFLYGMVEIITSVIVMFLTWVPQKSFYLLDQGNSLLGKYLLTGIGVVTGIYIFVRGMANVDEALPANWRRPWNRLFRGSR